MKQIYHPYWKWECHPRNFFAINPPKGMSKDQCEETYRQLLSNLPEFEKALFRVIREWPFACEHNLSNDRMNRIAWLGQASLCITHGIPAIFRGGFNLLTEAQQLAANEMALKWLNIWLILRNEKLLTLKTALPKEEDWEDN